MSEVVSEGVTDQPRRSLLGASAAPAVGTALSRASGLVRVSALTAALGLTGVADTYNLANTTPNILYELVLGGVFSSTLVPMFIHTDRGGPKRSGSVDGKAAPDAASVIVTVGFVAITALTVLAVLASPLINWQIFARRSRWKVLRSNNNSNWATTCWHCCCPRSSSTG